MTNFDVILKNDFIKEFIREKFSEKTGKIVLQIFITTQKKNKDRFVNLELIQIPGTDYSIFMTGFKKQNKIGSDKADTSKVFGFQILDYDDYTAVDCYINTPQNYFSKILG